jgi:hypothetical protein
MTERRLLALFVLLAAAAPLAAQQRPGTRAPAQRPSAQRPAADTSADTLRIEYRREVFSYQGGSRDPFLTLITSGDVRPTIDDLSLVSIAYDPRGNSVAVVREAIANGTKTHRLRRGNQIGRLRVIQIRQREVVFQIEEFGFERQQVLSFPRREAN